MFSIATQGSTEPWNPNVITARHSLSALVLTCHLMPKVNDTNMNGGPVSKSCQILRLEKNFPFAKCHLLHRTHGGFHDLI